MRGDTEFLVKWEGYDEATWEPASNIVDRNLISNYYRDRKKKVMTSEVFSKAVKAIENSPKVYFK